MPKVKKVKICHQSPFVIHCFKPIQAMAFCFVSSELIAEDDGWF